MRHRHRVKNYCKPSKMFSCQKMVVLRRLSGIYSLFATSYARRQTRGEYFQVLKH